VSEARSPPRRASGPPAHVPDTDPGLPAGAGGAEIPAAVAASAGSLDRPPEGGSVFGFTFAPGPSLQFGGALSFVPALDPPKAMTATDAKQRRTTQALLNWAADCLRKADIEDPRLNAEVLLCKALSVDRTALYLRPERPVSPAEDRRCRDFVNRRAAREPLQYLVGSCEFYGREFEVTPAVLVPRQETELVVEKCLGKVGEGESWAADLGTGSGIIAVSLTAARPALSVIATDSSPAALEVAARNAHRHGVADRVLLAAGDLAEPVPRLLPVGRRAVDLVASNPPYVPTAWIERLQPEVRDHEPRAALDGGPDGLAVVRRLVPQAARLLGPGGWLVLELGEGQADAVRAIAREAGAFAQDTVETVTDPAGCERVFAIRRQNG